MSSLQRCLPCIFVINVVTSTSMQTRHRDVADFSPCSAVIFMPCSSHCISTSVAPFCVCNMSNCASQRVHHFIPLHHFHLSSSWWLKHCCKGASWCFLLSVNTTCSFVIFAMSDVCILWTWSLNVFWTRLCLLYGGAYHVFLWLMWWLAQACKLGFVIMLILVPVLL